THDFPYIWDEISLPVRLQADHEAIERVLLEAAQSHAMTEERVGTDEMKRLEERFGIRVGEIDPKVFWRITSNWVDLTVRFLAPVKRAGEAAASFGLVVQAPALLVGDVDHHVDGPGQ